MLKRNFIYSNRFFEIMIIFVFMQTSKIYCDAEVINNSHQPKSNRFVCNEPTEKKQKDQPIVFLTIPKSGTHLLEKAYHLIINDPYWEEDKSHYMGFDFFRLIENPVGYFIGRKKNYSFNHFWFDVTLSDRLVCDGLKLVLLVRDPRDVIMSIIYANNRANAQGLPGWLCGDIDLGILPLDKKISTLLQDDSAVSLKNMYITALRCMQIPSAHIVYFEDLIGSKGGGI